MRIVSLCPSNTEIVWALGLADSLVGLDRSSDFPESVVNLPRVGPDITIDIDAVAALKPDLVLSSLSVPGMERNVEGLDAAGLPHVVLNAQSLAEVFESVRVVGRLVGRGKQANEVVAAMQARLDALKVASAELPSRPSVCIEWWPKPVIVPGARCWTAEMVRLAGGEPTFGHLDVRSTPLEMPAVAEARPDVLLTCWCGVPHDKQRPDKLGERPGWDGIPAVQNGHVWAAEERYFGRPGPRLVEGVAWLHARLRERAGLSALT